MKQIQVASFIAALIMTGALPYANASVGTEGASFLDIPVGAGPASMGSAYTSLATNAYAPNWNAAGLGRLNSDELAAQHLSYLESIHYEHLSYVHPLGHPGPSDTRRGLGFSVQYLGSGDITRTDVNTGDAIGDFSSYYAAYNLAYGQTVTDKLALGVTGKMIRAKIDDVSAGAYAADLGGLYKMTDSVQLGASLVNVGSKLKFLSEGDSLPLAFKVGAAYQPTSHYLVSTEGVYRKNGLGSFHLGGQWRPLEMISVRLGYKTDTLKGLSAVAGLTAGLGIHVWGQEFAYAWAPYGDLGDAQYFSLLLRFGAPEESRQNLIQYQSIKKHRTVRNGEEMNRRRQKMDKADEFEPEYKQLMQLLAEDDAHVASSGASRGSASR